MVDSGAAAMTRAVLLVGLVLLAACGCAPTYYVNGRVMGFADRCPALEQQTYSAARPVPRATVTVRCGGEVVLVTEADDRGRIRAVADDSLPMGCTLTAEAPGFAPETVVVAAVCTETETYGDEQACFRASMYAELRPVAP